MKRLTTLVAAFVFSLAATADPLPSWRDGATKQSILDFVSTVSSRSSKDFVPASERIAVFDNDGTLWVEQPIYTQLAFALDRVKTLAPQHPEWTQQQPFKAVLEHDIETLKASGTEGVMALVAATHADVSTATFQDTVTDWLATARHPRFGQPYTKVVYEPMLELLELLRAKGFKTFIVSGGGIDFMRPWAEQIYGIPPERVIGSQIELRYESVDGEPRLMRSPKVAFIDDKAGKPVAIQRHIGRRPILAVGNSDGDFEMLEWTTAGDGRRLGVIVRHDDAEREYAYDRQSSVGRLDKALDAAGKRGWAVVSMQRDWSRIFPPFK